MNHPVRFQVMPPLSPEEYQELHDDIAANGVLVPIIEDENGVIIDGHHRSKIASELGIPCPVETLDGKTEEEKRGMAFTLNLKRRHLNREQRRALIAESLKADPQMPDYQHAQRTGASPHTVKSVRESISDLQNANDEVRLNSRGQTRPASYSKPIPQPELEPTSVFGEPQESRPSTPVIDTIMTTSELDALNTPPERADKPRAEPITNRFTAAVLELTKSIDRLHRLERDTNFKANKNQIATLHRNDLARATNELQQLTESLTKD